MGSRKQDAVCCVWVAEEKGRWAGALRMVINTQQAWVQGREFTQTSSCTRCNILVWLWPEQVMIILGFQSWEPHFFLHFHHLNFRKIRRKYTYFCFKRRFPKYVKVHWWKQIKSDTSEEGKGEKYSKKALQWPLLLKETCQTLLVTKKNPRYSSQP